MTPILPGVPAQFFKAVPMPLRPIVQSLVRRKVAKTLKLQGFGRHTPAEQNDLTIADINALASLLGEKAFLMGDQPCGADATVFAFVAGFLTPVFVTPIRSAAEKHQILSATATASCSTISRDRLKGRLHLFFAQQNCFWTVDR
jgi:hypothetical protein